jgi:predicted nucleic acid-binding Zn ribbon protein
VTTPHEDQTLHLALPFALVKVGPQDCPTCTGLVMRTGRGRPKVFCSDRCRSIFHKRHLKDRRGQVTPVWQVIALRSGWQPDF